MNKVQDTLLKVMLDQVENLVSYLLHQGPGATNAVTALTDVYGLSPFSRSPVPTHLIRHTLEFRPCTKHNWLSKINDLARVLHLAFEVATTGRPGPVLIDIQRYSI